MVQYNFNYFLLVGQLFNCIYFLYATGHKAWTLPNSIQASVWSEGGKPWLVTEACSFVGVLFSINKLIFDLGNCTLINAFEGKSSQSPLSLITSKTHCVKSVQIRGYFWSVFYCIRTEYRKIRTRNNSVFGHISRSDTENYYVYISLVSSLHVWSENGVFRQWTHLLLFYAIFFYQIK